MERLRPSQDNYQNFEFFSYSKERLELYKYSQAVSEYLITEKIPNLVLIDRSARPLYIGIKKYLRSTYPDEKIPNIYFINPKGFKTSKEGLTKRELSQITGQCVETENTKNDPIIIRKPKDVIKEFIQTYSRLVKDKKKPVLIFDTCIHNGKTLRPVLKIFKKMRFSDVRTGVINPVDDQSKLTTNFVVTNQGPMKGCYPFGVDSIIEKTYSHVYSQKTDNIHEREKSVRLRGEISKIINNLLENKI